MQHAVWRGPVSAWYSKDFYRDAGRNWRAEPFVYLLALLAALWVPMMLKFHLGLAEFLDGDGAKVIDQIPAITIENGTASADAEQPYYIRWPETGETIGIIDTTGETSSLEGTSALVLLRADRVLVRKDENEVRVYDLSSAEPMTLDREKVRAWARTAKSWAALIAYPFAVALSYGYRLVQALIYALIGLIFVRAMEVDLCYVAVLRLAVVALTPAVIGSTILDLLGVGLPAEWLIWFAVSLGYLAFAISANGREPADLSGGIAPGGEAGPHVGSFGGG